MTDIHKRTLHEKRKSIESLTVGLAKIPPHAQEVEQAVLGALMIQKSALLDVVEILRPNMFYDDRHIRIYKSIIALSEESSPIDLLTVSEKLRNENDILKVGGIQYLVELTNKVNSAANIEFHSRIIAEYAIKRQLIELSCVVLAKAYEDSTDVFEVLNEVDLEMIKISQLKGGKTEKLIGEYKNDFIEKIKRARDLKGLSGVPSGYSELDQYTGGWQKSDFIVIAARPAMGKTLFMIELAKNAAKKFNKKVAIFELEMSGLQLYGRIVSGEVGITNAQIKKGNVSDEQIEIIRNNKFLSSNKILIDDFSDLDVLSLRSKCIKYVRDYHVDMICLDYIQLMDGEGNNREVIVSKISRSLKLIAKMLDIPIIALAQLSRAVETRGGDKRPMLSDLRESGAIEQDADMVMFLYRPEYYKIEQDEDGNDIRGKLCVIISKHRNGGLGDIWLDCDLSKSTITDPNSVTIDVDYTFNDNGEIFELPNKTDVFKTINGVSSFE